MRINDDEDEDENDDDDDDDGDGDGDDDDVDAADAADDGGDDDEDDGDEGDEGDEGAEGEDDEDDDPLPGGNVLSAGARGGPGGIEPGPAGLGVDFAAPLLVHVSREEWVQMYSRNLQLPLYWQI